MKINKKGYATTVSLIKDENEEVIKKLFRKIKKLIALTYCSVQLVQLIVIATTKIFYNSVFQLELNDSRFQLVQYVNG